MEKEDLISECLVLKVNNMYISEYNLEDGNIELSTDEYCAIQFHYPIRQECLNEESYRMQYNEAEEANLKTLGHLIEFGIHISAFRKREYKKVEYEELEIDAYADGKVKFS